MRRNRNEISMTGHLGKLAAFLLGRFLLAFRARVILVEIVCAGDSENRDQNVNAEFKEIKK